MPLLASLIKLPGNENGRRAGKYVVIFHKNQQLAGVWLYLVMLEPIKR